MQKSKDKVLIPLFEDKRTTELDIIAIQEPWQNPFQPTTYNQREGDFYLAFPPQGGRACFYINKRLDLNKWSVEFLSPDMCILHIIISDIPLSIHNLYSQPPGSLRTIDYNSPIPLLDTALTQPGEHLVLGDFNLHHPLWSGVQDPIQHDTADSLLTKAQLANLQLLTPKGTITWGARGSRSTIDLAFGSEWAINRLLHCELRLDLDHRSDHFPIETTLAIEPVLAPIRQRRSWKSLDKSMVAAGAQGLRQPPTGILSVNSIEVYISYLMSFI